MTLFEKLLALPDAYTTAAQRAAWAAFVPKMPLLPVNAATKVIEPARIVQNGPHNGEGPELYANHPHRVYTMGRHVASGTDISIGEATFNSSGWGHGGEGWFCESIESLSIPAAAAFRTNSNPQPSQTASMRPRSLATRRARRRKSWAARRRASRTATASPRLRRTAR